VHAQRLDENAERIAIVASDGATQELIAFAKNRLNKIYNPRKLCKRPPATELNAEGHIHSNQGGRAVDDGAWRCYWNCDRSVRPGLLALAESNSTTGVAENSQACGLLELYLSLVV